MTDTCWEYREASAPGKVLVLGGYLILEREHSGLVLTTSSRFYARVQSGDRLNGVRVLSPQFTDGEWTYSADLEANEGFPIHLHNQRSILSFPTHDD